MDVRQVQSTEVASSAVPTLRRRFVAAGQLPLEWAIALGLGWPLVVLLGIALEPAPAHPHAATPLVVSVASFAALAGIYSTIAFALRRHPNAAVAGALTGVVLMAMSAACPLSGHHAFGLWWIAQFGLVVAMLTVSLAALRVTE